MLRILFPARCPLCDGVRGPQEAEVCPSCRRSQQAALLPFPDGFAPLSYSGMARGSIRRFKYHGRAAYASFYAALILQAGRRQIRAWNPEVILPVPIHAARRRERGYNQADDIARVLAKDLGIPCRTDIVYRRKNTVPQHGLTPAQRRDNLRHAFALRREGVLPKRVLLVDDIYTTGSTVMALKQLLLAQGAEEIHVVCVCVALSPDLW